jgi:hypothetical protein
MNCAALHIDDSISAPESCEKIKLPGSNRGENCQTK